MAKKAIKTLLVIGGVALAIGVALVAMRLFQGMGDSPAPMMAEKQAQLRALDTLSSRRDEYAGGFNPRRRESGPRDSGREGVGLFLRNTFFRIAGDIGFNAERLSALLIPKRPPQPVILDDPTSFVFKPLQGSVTMPASALAALFNHYLTAYPGSQMRDLSITTKSGKLIVNGQVSQVPGVWLPFHMEGGVRLLQGHLFVYKPTTIEVADIDAEGLLKAFNLQLSSLVTIATGGADLAGNEIVLDLDHALPPPTQDIKVAEMQLDEAGLHLTFTSELDPAFPEPIVDADSYLMLHSGDVKTLGALIVDARLQMVARAGGRLDLSFYNYRQQLRNGLLKTTPAGGIVAYMGPYQAAEYVPESEEAGDKSSRDDQPDTDSEADHA